MNKPAPSYPVTELSAINLLQNKMWQYNEENQQPAYREKSEGKRPGQEVGHDRKNRYVH